MKTEKTKVEGTCYIWAMPKSDWQIQQDLKEVDNDMAKVMPFQYKITTGSTNYNDDAVLVGEFDVVGTVPEGVDLVKAAVETLRDKIAEAKKEYEKTVADLEEKIKNLALIEYQPEA